MTHISLIPFVFKAAFEQGIPEDHTVRVGVFGLIMPMLDEMMGMRVIAAYGMTELVRHCIHSSPYEQYPDLAMGKVSPGYELLIVNDEDGDARRGGRDGRAVDPRRARRLGVPGVLRQRRGQREDLHRGRLGAHR